MKHSAILFPVFVLVSWTFLVLIRVAVLRFQSRLQPAEFAFGESERAPAAAKYANRNYTNLLELPVLFYLICGLLLSSGSVPPLALYLAWAYTGLRIAHSCIHMSYNNVWHRLIVFTLSNMTLASLWIVAGLQLTAG
ncbi:MAPEG family protein [Oxalobacteraceae bacterium]|nr:MAPEG family protein [Oxalobacteraceae bacterium]